MSRKYSFFFFICSLISIQALCQSEMGNDMPGPGKELPGTLEIKGLVRDGKAGIPLAYASVYIQDRPIGAISNEQGFFTLEAKGIGQDDTVCFKYIGYKTVRIPVPILLATSSVDMEPEIYDLNEMLVFGSNPDPRSIVKKIIEHKDSNYKRTTCINETFIREKDNTDFENIRLIFIKSTIPGVDEMLLNQLEQKIPRHTISYTDFLGNIYLTRNSEDSSQVKINPVRTVSLKEKEFEDIERFDTLFQDLFNDIGEDEYWKFRSGIFGDKIRKEDQVQDKNPDTANQNRRSVRDFRQHLFYELRYCNLDDKDQWEFLYHTGRYDYTLAGGTNFNGEEVYIIDFTPRGSGLYTGRLYVSIVTYALIRADYAYAPGRIGRDIHLLGLGYTETQFSGSIYFEKLGGNYVLKYFSKRNAERISVDRNIEITKKKERVLFDKELMEFKAEIELTFNTENSMEYYVLENEKIPDDQYSAFQEPLSMEIIYVEQFNDDLWSGYSIIEPTRQMREYRKQD